jgi:DNA replication protein DnaC
MARAQSLGLHGLVADWARLGNQPWLGELLRLEEDERKRRSLARRLKSARIGTFKPMVDYDWSWPKKINREAVEETVNGSFLHDKINIIILGPNGVSKTMIAKNTAYNAATTGHTVRFTNASDMLSDLAAQDSSSALARRLRRYCQPELLCIDEVGYLSYNARFADLLFEVISRRYQSCRPILLTTNKAFEHWGDVFPNAGCVVTLVDRLVHRCEQIVIEADSYRVKEAKERAAAKAKERAARRRKT